MKSLHHGTHDFIHFRNVGKHRFLLRCQPALAFKPLSVSPFDIVWRVYVLERKEKEKWLSLSFPLSCQRLTLQEIYSASTDELR